MTKEPEFTIALYMMLVFFIVAIVLLFLLIRVIIKYIKEPKKNINKKRSLRIRAIAFGLGAIACMIMHVHFKDEVLPALVYNDTAKNTRQRPSKQEETYTIPYDSTEETQNEGSTQ